jgi:hypothetical protein
MKLTSAEVQYRTPDDVQRGCPKHVEFYNRINFDNSAPVWLFKKNSGVLVAKTDNSAVC